MNYMFGLKGAMLSSSVNSVFLVTYTFLTMVVHEQHQEYSQGLFPSSQYLKKTAFRKQLSLSLKTEAGRNKRGCDDRILAVEPRSQKYKKCCSNSCDIFVASPRKIVQFFKKFEKDLWNSSFLYPEI